MLPWYLDNRIGRRFVNNALRYYFEPEYRTSLHRKFKLSSLAIAAGSAYSTMPTTPLKRTNPFNYPPDRVKRTRTFPTVSSASEATTSGMMSELIERKHGGAVAGSSYVGGFGRTKPQYENDKTAFLRSGCGLRDYISGSVTTGSANVTAYVGHSSFKPTLVLNVVSQAIIRKLWYKATSRDLTHIGSLILPNTNVTNIWVEYFDMDSNITRRADVGITTTDTLATAANKLAALWWNRIAAHEQDIYKYIYLTTADGTQAGGALSLSGLTVDLLCDSYLKIQNVTASTDVAVDDRENAMSVRHVPLQGMMYSGRGNWTMQKGVLQGGTHGGTNESPMESDGNTGLMVPNFNTGTTSGGVQTANVTGGWFLPQVPKQLMNCTGGASIKLSPGSIKSDMLRYETSISFNNLIGGLIEVPESVTTTPTTWSRQHTKRGQWKLFGLTRMLHTETTPVTLWYELWYDVYAKVNFSHNEVFVVPSPAETILSFSEGATGNQ